MKVLFVSSGNSANGISSLIKNQGESLRAQGVDIIYFTIKGKGLKGYLKNIIPLKQLLKTNRFDVVHAHYADSAFVASLALSNNIIVSLMGNDILERWYFKYINFLFYKLYWKNVIVKSKEMALKSFGIPTTVIPNGVDFKKFYPMDKKNAKLSLGWDNSKIHILFAANPNRPEKNFKLAKEVFTLLNQSDYEIHYFTNVDHDIIVNYFNASDIVLLTSLWEGSPNVIKEAMACNVPIVSTNVGDISEIIKNTEGCFVTDFDSRVIADKIILATEYIQGTSGRSDIKHLDSKIIAKRIIDIYNKIILK